MAPPRAYPNLPEDLICTNILPRLPAKSVGRFRCVSKPWKSLLTSPKFIRTHLKLHDNESESILMAANDGNAYSIDFNGEESHRYDGEARMVSHPYNSGRRIAQLGPSCHGLVLLRLKDRRPLGMYCNILINPVTKESVDFPDHDPRTRWCSFGLGYDSVSHDYKVVSVSFDDSAVNVYSVRTKTWRRVADIPYWDEYVIVPWETRNDYHCVFSSHGHHGMFFNGYIYWRRVNYDEKNDKNFFVLVAFNLASEEFEEVAIPNGMNGESTFEISVLDGFIALVFREPGVLHVWAMKEYGIRDCWINVASIKYPKMCSVDGEKVGLNFRVVCRLHGNEFVTEWDNGKFFACDWRNEKWRYLDIDDLPASYDDLPVSYDELRTFRGSLVSPNSWEE